MKRWYWLVLVALLFASCKEDDDSSSIRFAVGQENVCETGINFDWEEGGWATAFTCKGGIQPMVSSEMSVDAGEKWMEVKSKVSAGYGEFAVMVEPNRSSKIRTGVVTITAGREIKEIRVTQDCYGGLIVDRKPLRVRNSGGRVSFRMWAKGKPSVTLPNFEWAEVVSCEKDEDGNYEVVIEAEDNIGGFGRILPLRISANNPTPIEGSIDLPLIQDPMQFGDTVVVVNWGCSGKLSVLLGEDAANIGRIKHLEYRGDLDDYDMGPIFDFLHQRGSDSISIDLSKASFRGCAPSPYYYYTPLTLVEGMRILYDDIMPDGMFRDIDRLVECRLPKYLRNIGRRAFEGCVGLKRIFIPLTVDEIGDNAFAGCRNLREIYIHKLSDMRKLGDRAFFTNGSVIESLLFPVCMEATSNALNGLKVKNLYLEQDTPPAWMPARSTRIDSLYVPAGTVEAYRSAPGWGDVPVILPIPEGFWKEPWTEDEPEWWKY
ncbi:leucine-rich repeat protein [uncultured Duncaniella sp.]|uniref:leucine-rich repeat protein n=2 Tax=uncultured Duncaniella sp. TaxID=2768039 RepID=UPI00263BC313|nr:leucine-rich repeat protein [uncultured Duncaniella sp.]